MRNTLWMPLFALITAIGQIGCDAEQSQQNPSAPFAPVQPTESCHTPAEPSLKEAFFGLVQHKDIQQVITKTKKVVMSKPFLITSATLKGLSTLGMGLLYGAKYAYKHGNRPGSWKTTDKIGTLVSRFVKGKKVDGKFTGEQDPQSVFNRFFETQVYKDDMADKADLRAGALAAFLSGTMQIKDVRGFIYGTEQLDVRDTIQLVLAYAKEPAHPWTHYYTAEAAVRAYADANTDEAKVSSLANLIHFCWNSESRQKEIVTQLDRNKNIDADAYKTALHLLAYLKTSGQLRLFK